MYSIPARAVDWPVLSVGGDWARTQGSVGPKYAAAETEVCLEETQKDLLYLY